MSSVELTLSAGDDRVIGRRARHEPLAELAPRSGHVVQGARSAGNLGQVLRRQHEHQPSAVRITFRGLERKNAATGSWEFLGRHGKGDAPYGPPLVWHTEY